MSAISIPTIAAEITEQFADLDADVTEAGVEADLETLIVEYNVPADEAKRTVRGNYLEDAGLSRDALFDTQADERMLVDDVDESEQWVDLEVKVVDLWEDTHESMAQAGLLGDESGTIKFISWAASDLPPLREGESYRLDGVVTDEYEGRHSVKLVSTTGIECLATDVEVDDNQRTMEGALVDIKDGSGLIKRCPDEDCTRVIRNGRCSEHGDVTGEFDLRIKGVLDDGQEAQDVLLDADATEALTGMGLEEAKSMAMDALDTEVVMDAFEEQLVGSYYEVEGELYRGYLLVDAMDQIDEHDLDGAEETLIEARSKTAAVEDAAEHPDPAPATAGGAAPQDSNSTAGGDSTADSTRAADSSAGTGAGDVPGEETGGERAVSEEGGEGATPASA
ncbi:MAG: replication factor A1 [Haloarculaceae archaeon]|jgi:replication factor A1